MVALGTRGIRNDSRKLWKATARRRAKRARIVGTMEARVGRSSNEENGVDSRGGREQG